MKIIAIDDWHNTYDIEVALVADNDNTICIDLRNSIENNDWLTLEKEEVKKLIIELQRALLEIA
jgi:hypothetical protein